MTVINYVNAMANLAELLTNTQVLTTNYFDIFFNPEPMTVQMSQYNEDNELVTYNIPNRALDKQICLSGEGTPEGNVTAVVGTFYVETSDRILYVKTAGSSNTGWTYLATAAELLAHENSPSAHLACLARINGSEDQVFKVAAPTDPTHAVNVTYGGDKTTLTTTDKTSYVAAINELKDGAVTSTAPAITVNSGNVDSNGNADLVSYSSGTLSFKVDDGTTYEPIKATLTNTSKFERTSVPSIDMSSYSDGTYNIFVGATGDADSYANTIYRQPTEPSALVSWTQPTATSATTVLPEGDMVITANNYYSGEYPYFALDGDTNTLWSSNAPTGWWQVKFPYVINIVGLTFYQRSAAGSYRTNNARFYTSSEMTTPIGDQFTGSTTSLAPTVVTNIPESGVLTDTIYLNITSGVASAGMSNLAITATTPVSNNVWINNSVEPITIKKSESASWVDYDKVPTAQAVVASGVITSATTFAYNNWAENSNSAVKETVKDWIIPTQTGNNGKYLKTNGATLSWSTPSSSSSSSTVPFSINSGAVNTEGSANTLSYSGSILTIEDISATLADGTTFERTSIPTLDMSSYVDGTYNIFIGESGNAEGYTNTIYSKPALPIPTNSYTTVGTVPIVDGVASGFSTSNYLTTVSLFTPISQPWEQVWHITTGNDVSSTTEQFVVGCGGADQRLGIQVQASHFRMCMDSSGSSSWNIGTITGTYTVQTNTEYYVRGRFTGTTYTLEYSLDGDTYTPDGSITSSTPIGNNSLPLSIGANKHSGGVNCPFLGSIDLNNSYIKIGNTNFIGSAINDVWLDTSVKPYVSKKRTSGSWETFDRVPCGATTVASDAITSVTQPIYNMNGYDEIKTFPNYDKGTTLTNGTAFTATQDGWLYDVSTTSYRPFCRGMSFTPSADNCKFYPLIGAN